MQQRTVVAVELYGVEVLMWKGTRNSTNAQLILPKRLKLETRFEQALQKNTRKFRLIVAFKRRAFKYRKHCSSGRGATVLKRARSQLSWAESPDLFQQLLPGTI